jgi:TatD DNase family protein
LLIDSHAHLDSERYAEDRAAMLRRAWEAGVGTVLAIGIGEEANGMHRALDICREFNGQPNMPRLYASAGIYPHNTHEIDDAVLAKLGSLLAEPEVIACGEIGLDYYHEGTPHEVQREGLIRQLEIAAARKRPILIHCRPKDGDTDAWDDLFEILKTHWRHTGLGGVMHCFGSGWEQARRSLDLGFLLSFAGNLTFPRRNRCATWPPSCLWTGYWWRPTPPGLLRRPIAASAMNRPGSWRRPCFWPGCWVLKWKKSPPQPRKTSRGCFAYG